MLPLSFRPATPEELRFVRSSWFKSFQKAGAPEVGYDIYLDGMHRLIDHLLEHSQVTVATPTAVPEEICAWACHGVKVLHYVYCKFPYRHRGISGALLEHVGPVEAHTHETPAGRSLSARSGRFNPYLLMKGNP